MRVSSSAGTNVRANCGSRSRGVPTCSPTEEARPAK